jgi:hypothetical protein
LTRRRWKRRISARARRRGLLEIWLERVCYLFRYENKSPIFVKIEKAQFPHLMYSWF